MHIVLIVKNPPRPCHLSLLLPAHVAWPKRSLAFLTSPNASFGLGLIGPEKGSGEVERQIPMDDGLSLRTKKNDPLALEVLRLMPAGTKLPDIGTAVDIYGSQLD